LRNFGIQFDEVSFHPYDDYLEQIQKKIQERLQEGKQVKLIHFEIPLGPMLRVVDIDAIVQLAKKYNILTSLDASLGGVHHYSAYDQIDIVCHALSKIANGHGDLLGGAIVGKKELIEQIYFKGQVLFGCEMDPYRAALLASHLKTYELRYDRQHASAKKVVDFLLNYNKKTKGETQTIRAIHYLGLDHHPDKAIISKQMQGRMGDIIILELDSQVAENGEEFCRRLKLFQMTWGSGYCESLVIPLNHFVNHGNSKKAIGRHQLIRLSIGLEDPDDLIADLKQALNLCNHPLHPSKWKLSTQFIHPFDPRDYPAYFKTYIPILPPIQHATLSVPAPNIDFFDKKQFLYTRGRHVTNTDLEQRLAEVQKREACLVYASKIAAITSTFFSLLEKDDRVIIFQEASRKTKCALEHFRDHFGIKLEVITLKEGYLQELTKKIEDKRNGNVKLIHFAPLFQPMLRLVDIDEICKIAYKNGVYTSMDGTLGGIHQYTGNSCKVDIMFHDLSKIPNGHGNVLGGSVAGKKELIEQIYAKGRHACGASLDPFGAYLIMNNLQSYMVRYKAHSKNTQKIAQYLTKHPHIKSVRCLGLSNHPDTQLRRKHDKHRKDSGELIIFEIKEDRHLNATMFCRKLKLFQMALGNGSVVSMAFPVHSYLEKDLLNKQATKCNDRWVRLSIGLEAVEDLINDLGEVLD
jgi:cystathionine beta-lyase/cystathionine gamma-synthase